MTDELERFDRLGFEALDEEQQRLALDEENGGFPGLIYRGLATRPIFKLRDTVQIFVSTADYGKADKYSRALSLQERYEELDAAMQLMLKMLVKFAQLPYRHTTYWTIQLDQFVGLYEWIVNTRKKLDKLKTEQHNEGSSTDAHEN